MRATAAEVVAVDTSVAVALVVKSHIAYPGVSAWGGGRVLALSGHALVETYSVLTRLPGDARFAPPDAVRLMRVRFTEPITLPENIALRLPEILADKGIAGGATYDAMVALAAAARGVTLATRDARAKATYDAIGASVIVVG